MDLDSTRRVNLNIIVGRALGQIANAQPVNAEAIRAGLGWQAATYRTAHADLQELTRALAPGAGLGACDERPPRAAARPHEAPAIAEERPKGTTTTSKHLSG